MEAKRKWVRRIFWIVVVVGSLALGIGLAAGGLAGKPRLIVCLVWVVIVAVASMVVDMVWYRNLGKKVDALLPLMYTDPDGYIQGIEHLLGGSKSLGLQQTRNINLAAAHCEKGNYAQAARLLEELDPAKLPPQNKPVYWADYALTQFHLHRKKKACDILDAQAKLFAPLTSSRSLGGLLAVLEIFRLLAEGDQKTAREMLDLAKEAWPENTVKRELEYLEKQC